MIGSVISTAAAVDGYSFVVWQDSKKTAIVDDNVLVLALSSLSLHVTRLRSPTLAKLVDLCVVTFSQCEKEDIRAAASVVAALVDDQASSLHDVTSRDQIIGEALLLLCGLTQQLAPPMRLVIPWVL